MKDDYIKEEDYNLSYLSSSVDNIKNIERYKERRLERFLNIKREERSDMIRKKLKEQEIELKEEDIIKLIEKGSFVIDNKTFKREFLYSFLSNCIKIIDYFHYYRLPEEIKLDKETFVKSKESDIIKVIKMNCIEDIYYSINDIPDFYRKKNDINLLNFLNIKKRDKIIDYIYTLEQKKLLTEKYNNKTKQKRRRRNVL